MGVIAAAALISAACAAGSRRTAEPVGVSEGTSARSRAVEGGTLDASAAKRARSAEAAGIAPDFRTSLAHVNSARFVSNGHAAGRYEADVYGTAAGKDAALSAAAGGELPTGTRLVMEHFERAPAPRPGPVMLMEKMERGFDPDHGDWRYVVLSSAGDVAQQGRVESCAGCHDDAPRDHVFRILTGSAGPDGGP
jgi:hypothetical protein